MTDTSATDSGQLARAARLADLRQHLLAPAAAIREYSELLLQNESEQRNEEVIEDVGRIQSAARKLHSLVDVTLNNESSVESASSDDELERQLRHELRTPINAILGYGEMLLEDLDQTSQSQTWRDVDVVCQEARSLLGRIDAVVDFTRGAASIGNDQAHHTILPSSTDHEDLVSRTTHAQQSIRGRILVVDDIAVNRDLLQRRLEADGHQVEQVVDGQAALDFLKRDEFDLVLLDLMMPGLSGFDVLTAMKASENLRQIPVIMISALDQTESAIRCIDAGAYDYLIKPFNPRLLQARIRAGLESKEWTDAERIHRKFIQDTFSKFLSPAVVNQLMEDPKRLQLGGERTEISCVFTDIEGFTRLIENNEPTNILPILNRYLDGVCKIVLKHDGTIDKIVGDALHAFFGAPARQPDHAIRATLCAIELDQFARNFVLADDVQATGFGRTRIGVHSGIGVVGNFGGDAYFDYTAHGDVINTTARMEQANKMIGTTLCVSSETVRQCPSISFRPIGQLKLRGKTSVVGAFEPVDEEVVAGNSVRSQGRCPLGEYLEAYSKLTKDLPAAEEAFDLLAREYQHDPLVALYHGRLKRQQTGTVISAHPNPCQAQSQV